MENERSFGILSIIVIALIIGAIILIVVPNSDDNKISCRIETTNMTASSVELHVYSEGKNTTLKTDNENLNTTHYVTNISSNGIYTYYVSDGKKENSCTVEINSIIESDAGKINISTTKKTSSLVLTIVANSVIELADKPYSWDKITWSSNNTLTVTKNGTYTGYIKDRYGNISELKYKVSNIKGANTNLPEKQDNKITATGISFNYSRITLKKQESRKLIFTLVPSDANDYKVSWTSSNNKVAVVDISGNVTGVGLGDATIKAKLANGAETTCIVIVEEGTVPVTSIAINPTTKTIKVNEIATLGLTINPSNATDKTITWNSSDDTVVSVNNGVITGKKVGRATISAKSDNGKIATSVIVVETSAIAVTGIKLNKTTSSLKKGETETLVATITPSNATNKGITWSSNNTSIVKVDSNGKVTAVGTGTGKITAKTKDGNYSATTSYTITQKTGIVNGTGGVWGYSSSLDKTPDRADTSFFQNLVNGGKGTLSSGVYKYTSGGKTYQYNISTSTLTVDGKNILMRIYYPKGYDLSSVNTFTFMGGTSEQNLGGYFRHLDENKSEMKSSGIIILVSSPGTYYASYAIGATDFVKAIVGQKKGVKNTVGGYSLSGEAAGSAANSGSYDRLIICNSKFHADSTTNVINKDVVIFTPKNDKLHGETVTTLNYMVMKKYANVTVITNDSGILNTTKYSTNFLMINPGSQMGTGHGYVNISNAKIFAFACS